MPLGQVCKGRLALWGASWDGARHRPYEALAHSMESAAWSTITDLGTSLLQPERGLALRQTREMPQILGLTRTFGFQLEAFGRA